MYSPSTNVTLYDAGGKGRRVRGLSVRVGDDARFLTNGRRTRAPVDGGRNWDWGGLCFFTASGEDFLCVVGAVVACATASGEDFLCVVGAVVACATVPGEDFLCVVGAAALN
jgi:hypothetical protein